MDRPFRSTKTADPPELSTHHRNYLAVWPSMFAVSLGLMAIIPTLGLYVGDRFGLTGSDQRFWTGWAYASAPLAAACAGPFWGVLGDRGGRRRMVVRATLAIAVSTACMPWATSPGWLVVLRVLQGAFAGFVAPAMALGTDGVPAERQGHVIGRLQLAMALGLLVGPAVGAEVAFHFGRAGVFYFTSAVSLLAAAPVWFFVEQDRRETHVEVSRPPLLHAFRHDFAVLLGNRIFVALLGCVFLMRFGQHMVEPFVAIWVRELGALPAIEAMAGAPELALERTVALAFIVLAAAQLLLTTRWGRLSDRIGPLRCLVILGSGLSVVFFLTSMVDGITPFMILRCGAAVFMAGSMTLAYAAAARRVAADRKSLAFTLMQSGMQFGLALGPIVGGVLATGSGVPQLYLIGGGCLAVASVGMMILRVAGRALETQLPPPDPTTTPPR